MTPVSPSPVPHVSGPLIRASEMPRPASSRANEPKNNSELRPSLQARFTSVPTARQASGPGNAADEGVLEQYGQVLAGKLSNSTIANYQNCLRRLSMWLAKHRPAAGGLAGIRQADEKDARTLMLEYRVSPDLSTKDRNYLKPAVDALRAETGRAAGPGLEQGETNEAVLKRFRDAAQTRMTAGTAQNYESQLRGFGYWLNDRPEAGGLAAVEAADADVVAMLLFQYRMLPNLTTSARRNIKAAVDALRSRLSEPDEMVLKRFCDAAGPGTTSSAVSDRQSQLRAFCLWLQKRDPGMGEGQLLYIQGADEREVGTLVAEYCNEIGRASPHGSHIAGAVDALRSIGIVLDRYDKAARDGGEPDNPLRASQTRLSAFSFWLAQHHLQVRGLTGIVWADQAQVDALLHAYGEETILRKGLNQRWGGILSGTSRARLMRFARIAAT